MQRTSRSCATVTAGCTGRAQPSRHCRPLPCDCPRGLPCAPRQRRTAGRGHPEREGGGQDGAQAPRRKGSWSEATGSEEGGWSTATRSEGSTMGASEGHSSPALPAGDTAGSGTAQSKARDNKRSKTTHTHTPMQNDSCRQLNPQLPSRSHTALLATAATTISGNTQNADPVPWE